MTGVFGRKWFVPAQLFVVATAALLVSACGGDEKTCACGGGQACVDISGDLACRDFASACTGCTTGQVCVLDNGVATCMKIGDNFNSDCNSCRADGQSCYQDRNCPAGAICNLATADYFDPSKPAGACLKISCTTNADCVDPKKCSLAKVCEAPVCQQDSDCGAGNACIGGSCAPAPTPNQVASCIVVTPKGSLRQGSSVALTAVAKNAGGSVLPKISFSWTSNQPTVVSVNGSNAIGQGTAGTATITAKVSGNDAIACSRAAVLSNYLAVDQNRVRVVLVADDDGSAVSGAQVILDVGGQLTTRSTGTDGTAIFDNVTGTVLSITASAAARFQIVSVLNPPKDMFLPLPRRVDTTKAGGFRGSLDVTAMVERQVKFGLAGPSLPNNLLDFDPRLLLGDTIPTKLDFPGLSQTVPLPGGVVIGMSGTAFTDDSATTNVRCQGKAPAAGELGCFVMQAPKGPNAAWALAAQLTLSDISPLIPILTEALSGGGADDLPVATLLTKFLPILRSMRHGVNAGVVMETEFPKVNKTDQTGDCSNPNLDDYEDKCRGDFSKFSPIKLANTHRLALESIVSIPKMPIQSDGSYPDGAAVIVAALAEGRGMVPLGLSGGIDKKVETETGDGIIAGIEQPFGPDSDPLPDGSVPLSVAPVHSGLEGSKMMMVGVALGFKAGTGIHFSVLAKGLERIGPTSNFGTNAAFLPFPAGTFDSVAARFTPTGNGGNPTAYRLQMKRGSRTWLVYAPGTGAVTLPNLPVLRQEILTQGMDAFVQSARASASYAEVFTLGSGKNLNRIFEHIEAIAVQECTGDVGAACRIQ